MAELKHTGAQRFRTVEGDAPHTQERDNVLDGETTERLRPGEIQDDLYLSPEELKHYGIEGALPSSLADTDAVGDKVYCVMRDPARYGRTEPGHARRIKRRWKTYQPVIDPETKENAYATDDGVFYTVDREEYLGKRVYPHTKAAREFFGGVVDGGLDTDKAASGSVSAFKGSDVDYLNRVKAETQKRFWGDGGKGGILDKWGPGMTLEMIEESMGAERTQQIERKFARGGRSERPGEYEAFENKLRERNKAKEAGRAFSFPGKPVS